MNRKYGTLERLSKEEWERIEKEIKKKENKSLWQRFKEWID